MRRFELRIAIAALGASATAIAVARELLGHAPDFHVDALAYPTNEITPLFLALGALSGLAAIAYNRVLLGTIAAVERLARLPVELRAGLIGATVGTVAWLAPGLVGGGDVITQRTLAGAEALSMLPLVFLLRCWCRRCSAMRLFTTHCASTRCDRKENAQERGREDRS